MGLSQKEVLKTPLGKLLQLVHCALISNGAKTVHRYHFETDAAVLAVKRLKAQRKNAQRENRS